MLVPKLRFKEFTDEWKESELKKISSELIYGMNCSATDFDGTNKYIRITDINEETSLYNNSNLVSPLGRLENKYLVNENDILFARTGASTGKSYLYNSMNGKLYFAGFLIKAHINTDHNSRFIFEQFKLNKYKNWIKLMSMRSGQPGINANEYGSYVLSITSKNEENKIAETLELLDKKIELQTKKIEVLKIYKKGTLDNNIIFNNEKSIELDKVVIYQEGPGVRNNQYTNAGVKLLNVGNFRKNNLVLSTTNRYISEKEAFGIYKHFLVNDGDLLIACSGIKSEYFKEKIAFAKKEHLPLCMNTSTMRFKTNSKNLSIEYLFYVLQTRNIKKQLDNILSGSAQLNFGPSHIKYIKIPLIDIKEQQKIVYLLEKITNKINCETEKFNLLIQFKKGLMQNMFV